MQSSQVLRALPVVACLSAPFAPLALAAQARFRVLDEAWFYQLPEGKRIANITAGALVTGGERQGDWQAVELDGWIFGASVGATPRAGYDLVVLRAPEENLRATPEAGGVLLGKLPQGFLLSKVAEDAGGRWVHVQRSGWMPSAVLGAVADSGVAVLTPGRRPGDNPPSTDSGAQAPPDSTRLQARRTTLYRAPDGPLAGTVAQSTPLRVLSKSGDWARVQLEGWVKAGDIETAPAGALVGVSAAELRADPARYVGQTVKWTVQFLAQEQADELRPEMPAGAQYLLARGPLPERGFVYIVVPEGKQPLVARLAPLSVIDVIARVRAGKTRYLGNPVVELVSLEMQPQP